jgi:spermidine/putrescine transport system ATP-binding protein
MIEVQAVSKTFGQGAAEVRALDDVSFTIGGGEFFTLLGPSGCGKTTLLRLLAGFETPSAGRILLDGAEVTGLPPNRRPVNTVFQSYALFPHLTVAENVGFALRMQGKQKPEIAATVAEMLALVRMEALAARRPAQLSGGQQQRVALARALAPHPKVLLLDEPLSALDLKLRKEMQVELKRLQTETGITFVFVTHDQEEALTMSDHIAVMSAGSILQIGTPREIYIHPRNRFVADFIGETNFLPATLGPAGAMVGAAGPFAVEAAGRIGAVTLAVRPEHTRIARPDDPGTLPARVIRTVYFGTDSHVHLRLDDGTPVVARVPAGTNGAADPEPGVAAGIAFVPGALQVLAD